MGGATGNSTLARGLHVTSSSRMTHSISRLKSKCDVPASLGLLQSINASPASGNLGGGGRGMGHSLKVMSKPIVCAVASLYVK